MIFEQTLFARCMLPWLTRHDPKALHLIVQHKMTERKAREFLAERYRVEIEHGEDIEKVHALMVAAENHTKP